MAKVCNTVFVEPSIAISRANASSIASRVTISLGFKSFLIFSTSLNAAALIISLRCSLTAKAVPLYGSAKPKTSIKQFIEFAVNIPAQEPQVGQAFCSISRNSSFEIEPSLNAPTASNMDDNVNAFP